MKSKKVIIIVSILILVIVAVAYGVHNFYSSYMFNEDGTISGTGNDLYKLYFEQLEKVSGDDKINLIKFGVEQKIITQKEADELLK